MVEKILLTFEETAASMGCSIDTIRARVKAGELRTIDDRGQRRIPRAELERWTRERTR